MKLRDLVNYEKYCLSCENFTVNCPYLSLIKHGKCLGWTAFEERKENENNNERKETI